MTFFTLKCHSHYKLCADEKGTSSSLILNLLVTWRDNFEGISFGEILENRSSKKFANSLFMKINPRQNDHSDFARISRISTN